MVSVINACGPVTAAEIAQLRVWSRSRTSPHRLVVHSRIILLASEGLPSRAIAARLSISVATARLWCGRFRDRGLSALEREMVGRGRPPGMSLPTVIAVLQAMAHRGAADAPLTARRLAARAGTSASTVSRIWRRYGVNGSSPRERVQAALQKVIPDTRERG